MTLSEHKSDHCWYNPLSNVIERLIRDRIVGHPDAKNERKGTFTSGTTHYLSQLFSRN